MKVMGASPDNGLLYVDVIHEVNWSVRYVRDAVLHRASSVSKLRT
jgi:hypothetical protein